MKTITEMKETVRNFLTENGFVKNDYFWDDTYYIPGRAEIKTEKVTTFKGEERENTYLRGVVITVRETYRNNGTDANQSIYIEVENREWTTGRISLREKLYSKHGEKKTAAILQNVLNAYNA